MNQGLSASEALYSAMIERNPRFDGILYVGIMSTGIVCYPSCRSRLPRRENIRVFESVVAAVEAGFRPCKRCRPDSAAGQPPDAELVRKTEALIAGRFSEPITLESLAQALNVSPYHLQRIFKRVTGQSPTERLRAVRLAMAQKWLSEEGATVRDVALRSGFQSPSYFAARFQEAFGVRPSIWRETEEQDGGC